MRTNRVKEAIADGTTVMNAWVSCDSPYVAEVLSYAGYDAVTIDLQHGMLGTDRLSSMLQAVSCGPAVPMVRCSRLDAAEIGYILDAGAYGVICPGIDGPQQAAALVAACRYPPAGHRSYGPARGLLYGGVDYVQHADTTVQVWAMVESATGLAQVQAIAAVPGLDGIYVGPNDLALSMGLAPNSTPVPAEVRAALTRILEVAHRSGVAVGTYCGDPQLAAELAADGFDLVTPGNDVVLLKDAASRRLAIARGTTVNAAVATGY